MASIEFEIRISAEEYLKRYKGVARDVFTHAKDGRSIRFPASILQPFILHDGIRGCFRIHFNAEGKFERIERVS